MATQTLSRPDSTEFPSYAAAYVNLVPHGDILAILAAQPDSATALLKGISEETAMRAYAPGKWTVKQVIGHVTDTERIFGYRALRIARGDSTPLEGFEQDDYVREAGSTERSMADLLEEFRVVRLGSQMLYRGLPQEAWLRRGVANKHEVTVRGLAFLTAGHAEHHLRILREKYLK